MQLLLGSLLKEGKRAKTKSNRLPQDHPEQRQRIGVRKIAKT
jgi:hypothetical protein